MSRSNSTSTSPSRLANFKADFMASIVVFLVAVTLCMGIALASGVPEKDAAAVGIISGIVGGIVVGGLGGSPLQVSGPAAGLAVIVSQHIREYGYEALGFILLVAGGIQLISGIVGIGQWFRAVSPAVIQGMLAGIGVLIFASQFHMMVDDIPPGKGKPLEGLYNLYTIPQAVWKGVTEDIHQHAAFLGLLTLLVVIGWGALAPRKLKVVPAPLVGVLIASCVAAIWGMKDVKYVFMPDNLLEAISFPKVSAFMVHDTFITSLQAVLVAGVAMAFVASAESLLTATAADSMQQHAPRTKYDRELAAQGIGNLLCGTLGVLPVTGVIVRTGANIQAGARTRASTVMHGVWLLVFAVCCPWLLKLIPVASLAALLVHAGYKLMNPKPAKILWQYGKSEVAIYAVTLICVVAINLLTGIIIGLALAVAKLVYTFSHLRVRLHEENGRTILHLDGAATFVRLPKLATALESVAPSTELHVHFEGLSYIDHACLDLLMNWEKQHEATGGSLVVDWESLTARFRQFGVPNARPPEIERGLTGTGGNGGLLTESTTTTTVLHKH